MALTPRLLAVLERPDRPDRRRVASRARRPPQPSSPTAWRRLPCDLTFLPLPLFARGLGWPETDALSSSDAEAVDLLLRRSGATDSLRIVLAGEAMYHRDAAPWVQDALRMRRNLRRRLPRDLYDAVCDRLRREVEPSTAAEE